VQPHRRPRAEDCERLAGAQVRCLVAPGANSYGLPGGPLIQLRWVHVKAYFGGSGVELMLGCPQCHRFVRVLRCPPGGRWACLSCMPLSYASHRRAGGSAGGRKPPQWHLAQISAKQERVVKLLGLQQWPPAPLLWTYSDLAAIPRAPGAPRLHAHRREALLMRLDALETLRIGAASPLVGQQLEPLEGDALPPTRWDELTERSRAVVASTAWAVRHSPARRLP